MMRLVIKSPKTVSVAAKMMMKMMVFVITDYYSLYSLISEWYSPNSGGPGQVS